MLIDIILKPVDSYWKRRYKAEARAMVRMESNLRYSEGLRKNQEEDIALLSERDAYQAMTIEAFNEERARMQDLIDTLQRQLYEFRTKYAASERARKSLGEKLERTRGELADEYDSREKLLADVDLLRSNLHTSEREKARLEDELKKLYEDHTAVLAGIREEVSA